MDRAGPVLSMRESYRQDLRRVKKITDVEYIRFHAIFLDEMGVYDEDSAGRPVYNFSYVDQVYDGLLQNGVRPFVELSFMPKKLASRDAPHAFWYKQNVAPPKDWAKWDELIYQFTKHLSIGTAPMKLRSGTSKSGTNPISISGLANRSNPPTGSFTITRPRR